MCSTNPTSSDIIFGGMSYGGPRKAGAGEDFDLKQPSTDIKQEISNGTNNTDDIDDFLYGEEKKSNI